MGVKLSKRYSSHSYGSFSSKLCLKIPCDSPHKVYLLAFAISFKKKKIEIFVNIGPYGSENFKTLLNSPTVVILCQPNFSRMFPVTTLTKVTYWDSEISNSNCKKKDSNLTLWLMGKFLNATPPTVMVLFQPNFSKLSRWQIGI